MSRPIFEQRLYPASYLAALLLAAVLCAGAAIVGAAPALAATLIGSALYLTLFGSWRRGVYGMLLYIPFYGLPVFAFPDQQITRLLKDLIFVVPAYLGFAWWCLRFRRQPFFVGAPLKLIAALAVLLLLQLLNPNLVNPLVGLIGLKTWLWYIPMLFLGYHLLRSREELFKLVDLLLWIAMVPAAFGVAQAALVYSGHRDLAYAIYGPLAGAVTQGFIGLGTTANVGAQRDLVRVPSLFTYVEQYWLFLLAMLAIGYPMLERARRGSRPGQLRYAFFLGLFVVAAMASGARAAFVLLPAYAILATVLTGHLRMMLGLAAVGALALAGVATLLGVNLVGLLTYIALVLLDYLGPNGIIREHIVALHYTVIGVGTGMSTGPARFAFPGGYQIGDLVGLESFYAKTIVEIGVLGLLFVLGIYASLLVSGFRVLARLRSADPTLHVFAGTLLAYLILHMIYLTKLATIDYEPTNALFWLFAGILLALPRLTASAESPLPWTPAESGAAGPGT